MSRVLIVEDEQHLAEGLRFNLEVEGYDVEVVETGEEALARFEPGREAVDLVVLDVMLPGIDGFAVVKRLRDRQLFLPVLMLTAREQPQDIVRGIEAGADDYLTKPFDLGVLIARVQGLLRRRAWGQRAPDGADPPAPEDQIGIAGRTIDFATLEVHHRGRTWQLTAMEAKLLRYLLQHRGRAVSRKAILEDVWGVHEDTDTRAIDNFIVRLRRYVEDDPSEPRHLVTVRGIGYRLVDVDAPPGA